MPKNKLTVYSLQSTARKKTEDGRRKTEDFLKGFTLIEVLVSIAIIGVVFGIIISSTAAIQKTSRDTQRKSDLRNIQTSLQQYYADQNFYPTTLSLISPITITSSTGNPSPPSPVKTYMSSSPIDPLAGNSVYCYQAQATISTVACDDVATKCHYYNLTAKLEGSPSGTISCGAVATYNFLLSPIP